MLINVKMSTIIVGIFKFVSMVDTSFDSLKAKEEFIISSF